MTTDQPTNTLTDAEHYPTTPVQCICGWRMTDPGAGRWVDHFADVLASRAAAAPAHDGLRAAVEALRGQAAEFRDIAADAWGGDRSWITTGSKAAELAAEWCDESAAALSAAPAPTSVTSVEPGCTCGGIAACQQCQERDAAPAPANRERETVERVRALLPDECWVLRSSSASGPVCTDMIGGGFPEGAKFIEDMCCLPCCLRAALDGVDAGGEASQASSCGPVAANRTEVAPGATDDTNGPQNGSEDDRPAEEPNQ